MSERRVVMGIDTSLRSTGLGVVEQTGRNLRALAFGAIVNRPKAPLTACLARISQSVEETIDEFKPDAVAVEGAFFSKNAKTAIILGEARGAAIAACARRGVAVFEYAPRSVKQALVGFGSAEKRQVRGMAMTLLGLREEPQEDVGDALALAICHLNRDRRFGAAAAPQL